MSEGRSTFILSAKRPLIFEKVKFDNCKCEISQPNDERCDWVIGPKDHEKLYFVELKGGDIVKALGQLESAVKIIKPSKKFECHIVKVGAQEASLVLVLNFKFYKKFRRINGEIFSPHTNLHTIHI